MPSVELIVNERNVLTARHCRLKAAPDDVILHRAVRLVVGKLEGCAELLWLLRVRLFRLLLWWLWL